MQISVEMAGVSKKTQFHIALSIALFIYFLIFFKTLGVGTCGISALVQQLNNCKKPDLESPFPKLSNGICLQNFPRGGGGGFHALAHGLIVL